MFTIVVIKPNCRNTNHNCRKKHNCHNCYHNCRNLISQKCRNCNHNFRIFFEKFYDVVNVYAWLKDDVSLRPSGQHLGDSARNLRGLWLLVKEIHAEIWVVSDTRIHVEIQGKFSNWGWNKREVSPNLSIFEFTKEWHQIVTGIFSRMLDPTYVIILHFAIFQANIWEISTENSPSIPRGNYVEISTGMIPWNSPINPCGNLGDVDLAIFCARAYQFITIFAISVAKKNIRKMKFACKLTENK